MLLHSPRRSQAPRRGVSRSMRFQSAKKLSAAGDSETTTRGAGRLEQLDHRRVVDPVAVLFLVTDIRRINVKQSSRTGLVDPLDGRESIFVQEFDIADAIGGRQHPQEPVGPDGGRRLVRGGAFVERPG